MSDELPPIEQIYPAVEHVMGTLDHDAGTIQNIADRLVQHVGASLDPDKEYLKKVKARLSGQATKDVVRNTGQLVTDFADHMRTNVGLSVDADQAHVDRMAALLRPEHLPASPAEAAIPVPTPGSCPQYILDACLPGGLPAGWTWAAGAPCYAVRLPLGTPLGDPPTSSPCWTLRYLPGGLPAWHLEYGGGPPPPPPPVDCQPPTRSSRPPGPGCVPAHLATSAGRAIAINPPPGYHRVVDAQGVCWDCPDVVPPPPPPPGDCPPCPPPVVCPPPGPPGVCPCPPLTTTATGNCGQLPSGLPSIAVYQVPWLDPGDAQASAWSDCGRKAIAEAMGNLYPASEIVDLIRAYGDRWYGYYIGHTRQMLSDVDPDDGVIGYLGR